MSAVQTTKAPFMNVIYDKDPISQWVFGRVAFMGEAAHPTTPHGSRRLVSLCMVMHIAQVFNAHDAMHH